MRPSWLLLATFLLGLAHLTPVQAQLPQPVSEAELRALIPGSTMTTVNSRGQNYRETYAPNGRLNASSTRTDGSCCIADGGRWDIEAGQLCRQYDNWGDKRRFCIPLGRAGNSYVNISTGVRMEFSRP